MTLANVSEVFLQCEHPFYKEVEVQSLEVSCVLYSSATSYLTTIQLPTLNWDQMLHQISIELIRLRSYEWMQQ